MPAFIPVGSWAWMSGITSRTFLITSSEFAVGSTHTPMNVAACPLKRTSESEFSAPNTTSATSPMRTTTPLSSLTTSWRNSSGVRRSVLATRFTDTIEPFVRPRADR